MDDAIIEFTTSFLRIFIEAAPFLLVGTLTSGLIEAFVSQDDVIRFIPRHPILASLVGGMMGFAFPVGECGVVPVARRLNRKGLPTSASVAFLLASPIVNPIVIASTYAAFHERAITIVYWRVGVALIVAVSIGILFAFQPRLLPTPEADGASAGRMDFRPGLKFALSLATHEFLELGRYLILGSLLAAGIQMIITQGDLETLATNPVNSVFVMQALAFTRSIGSATDAFVASEFVDTFALGSILAFLTFGPVVDIKNIFLLWRVFRKRIVLYLILLPFLMIALIAVGVNAAQRGRPLLDDASENLAATHPRIVYLAPADEFDTNIYMADLETGEIDQLTDSDQGMEDYAVSLDGRQIAYSQNNDDGTADIWILDVADKSSHPVTRCVDARCYSPSWNMERGLLAYQRDDLNFGQSRVWTVDLKTLDTQLLFRDPQILGSGPRWSPDGRRIAVYDPAVPGIRIYDTVTQADEIIESLQGVVGYWSPDGQELIYPILTRGLIGQEFYTYLEMINLENGTSRSMSGPDDAPVDDKEIAWLPDGQSMAVARRYLDERFTRGTQIYLLNIVTGEVEPLVTDPDYHHAFISWDASGQRLVFQRFYVSNQEALPEIWTYDLSTDELKLVAENAYMPHWLP